MQRLEVSCAVRRIYTSLGAKGLKPYVYIYGCITSNAINVHKCDTQDIRTYERRAEISYAQFTVLFTFFGASATNFFSCTDARTQCLVTRKGSRTAQRTSVRLDTAARYQYFLITMHTSHGSLHGTRSAVHSFCCLSSGVHSLFQSQFPTECDTVFPLSIYSILSFP